MIVHQLLSGAGPVDAVTGQALTIRRELRRWGFGGDDFAVSIDPRMNGEVRPFDGLVPAPEDVLLIHYSAYAPRLRGILDLPNPKLLISHNVTPARWLWGHEPTAAIHCALGRSQLPEFARRVDLAGAVSEYNAAELRAAGAVRAEVIPLLFDRDLLGKPGPPPEGPPTVLFVGRISPHKRHDEVVRAFALYRRHRAPDARLVLVGEPVTSAYKDAIERLARQLVPGAVTIEGGVASERLWEHYRHAHAFLCLSEHEGFCIPLLEAFHFGVPVVARPAGGIAEVAGDGALLVDDPDLAVVAELLHLAVTDRELRTELRRRGEARLEAYAYRQSAERLRAALETVASR